MEVLCVDAHNIPIEDTSFDCVIVNSLLHHLDLKKALKEIHRVTKKDGYLIFKEPLGTNIFFQIYRKLTPNARTPDEKPFHQVRCKWKSESNLLNLFLPVSKY